ncbi:MAG TPA: hypothetical protein VHZ74_20745 [Bryobacteraceae bacterium]|jgi:hypothetical protein|nr:hypothetical protein [Bryobacteraceae bacterium]
MAERRPRARKAVTNIGEMADIGNPTLEEKIEILIGRYIDALEKNELKLTVADLVRLRKLQKELSPKRPVYAEVIWIDGWEQIDAGATDGVG